MRRLTLEDLQSVAREVIGDDEIALAPEMSAADVPGWDSLNHTLICVEIGLRLGRRVEPAEIAGLADFGAMIEHFGRAT